MAPVSAKFGFTDTLVTRLKAALTAAGISDLQLILNDGDEDFDDLTDDGVEFAGLDGHKLATYVCSGPYGLALNEAIFDEAGEFVASNPGVMFEVTSIDAFVGHVVEQLQVVRTPAPAAP